MRESAAVADGRAGRPEQGRVLVGVANDPFEATQFFEGLTASLPPRLRWLIDFRRNERSILVETARYAHPHVVVVLNGDAALLRELAGLDMPIVSVDGVAPVPGTVGISVDNPAIGRLGALHLIDQGFTRLAYVDVNAGWSHDRGRGFAEAAAARGVQHELHRVPPTDWNQMLYGDVLPALLRRLSYPIAVMACNDEVACRLIDFAVDMGLSVPGDLAVLGVDDRASFREVCGIGLSSIPLDRQQAGRIAGRVIDQLVRRPRSRHEPVLVTPHRVAARQSTQFVQFRDQRINAAITYIQSHACGEIGVADVARSVGMSLSSLHRLFRAATGRGPAEEIRRVRLHQAMRLVTQTHMPLAEVCAACGFSSMSYMSHAFSRAFGRPPGRMREEAISAGGGALPQEGPR